jgi:hypothetical protein
VRASYTGTSAELPAGASLSVVMFHPPYVAVSGGGYISAVHTTIIEETTSLIPG